MTNATGLRPLLGSLPVAQTTPTTTPTATTMFMKPPSCAHSGAVFHRANATTAPAPTWVMVYGPPQMRPPLGSFPTSMGMRRAFV